MTKPRRTHIAPLARRVHGVPPRPARAPRARLRGAPHRRRSSASGSRALGIEHHPGIGRTGIVAVDPRPRRHARGRAVGPARRHGRAADAGGERRSRTGRATTAGCTAAATTATRRCCSAAARYLHETRNFDGTAYLIFQPGEEGYAGAKAMIDDGLFERFPADAGLRAAQLARAAAGTDRHHARARRWRRPTGSRSRIDGRGGHGAHPHAAVDPVLVAGHIITAVQSIVSRNVSPIDTAVVSLCAMHAGQPGRDERDSRARDAGRHRAHVPRRRRRT